MKTLIYVSALTVSLAIAHECPVPEPFHLLEVEQAKPFQQAELHADNHYSKQNGENNKEKKGNRAELVNLWATWCPPCRKELPFLQQLSQDNTAAITLVNIDDTPEDAESTLKKLGITALKTRYAEAELLDSLAIQGLPTSMVFHQDAVYLGVGVLKDEQAIRDWLLCLPD